MNGGRQYDFLLVPGRTSADPDAVFATLHFELGDSGLGRQVDQLADLFNGHQWNSLAERERGAPAVT
jgi:hypothetical protein